MFKTIGYRDLDVTARKHVTKLRRFLFSKDLATALEGVSLAASVGDPQVFDYFLSGTTYYGEPITDEESVLDQIFELKYRVNDYRFGERVDLIFGTLKPGKILRDNLPTTQMPNLANTLLLALIGAAPDGSEIADHLKKSITHLSTSLMDFSVFEPFRNLRFLQVTNQQTTLGYSAGPRYDLVGSVHGLECLGSLSNLIGLCLMAHDGVKDLNGLEAATHLVSVNLSHCPIENIDGLRRSTGLRYLRVEYCNRLNHVDGLSGCKSLQKVVFFDDIPQAYIGSCSSLRNVDGLADSANLSDLSLAYSASLENVDGLAGCTSLRSLSLYKCETLRSIKGIEGLRALEHLDLGYCESLESLEGLQGCNELKSVSLRACTFLRDTMGISLLPNLVEARVIECGQLSVPPRKHDMRDRESVKEYQRLLLASQGLKVPSHLEPKPSKQQSNSPDKESRSMLAKVRKLLKYGDINEVRLAVDFISAQSGAFHDYLLDGVSLEELDSWGSWAGGRAISPNAAFKGKVAQYEILLDALIEVIATAPDTSRVAQKIRSEVTAIHFSGSLGGNPSLVTEFHNLKQITLSQFSSMQCLFSLEKLSNLQKIDIYNCEHLEDISSLAKASALKSLDVRSCPKIRDFSAISECRLLQTLRVGGGSSGESIMKSVQPNQPAELELLDCDSVVSTLPFYSTFLVGDSSVTIEEEMQSPTNHTADMAGQDHCHFSLYRGDDGSSLTVEGQGGATKHLLKSILKSRSVRSLRFKGPLSEVSFQDSSIDSAIEIIQLEGCHIENFAGLDRLRKLNSLTIDRCTIGKHVKELPVLDSVRSLEIRDNDSALPRNWADAFPNLEELDVNMPDVPALRNMPNLAKLDVSQNRYITNLDFLHGLGNLRWLNLCGCESLVDVKEVSDLPSLEYLHLWRCKRADVIPDTVTMEFKARSSVARYQDRVREYYESL